MSLITLPIIKSISPYFNISKSVFHIIHTGISSTLSIIKTLNNISIISDVEPINNFLTSADLIAKLEIIDLLLKDLNNKQLKDSQLVCLDKIATLIEKIKNSLIDINSKINNHCNKYLYYYRSLDLSADLICLQNDTFLLNNRIDLFLKLLRIDF